VKTLGYHILPFQGIEKSKTINENVPFLNKQLRKGSFETCPYINNKQTGKKTY